jgi:CHASE3 domain sensor protein
MAMIQWLTPEEEQMQDQQSICVDVRWILAVVAYVASLLAAHGNGWI